MSDKQKEASAAGALASQYKKIAAVFEAMPDRFKLTDLLRAAEIKDGMMVRSAVAAVLSRDFRCVNVGVGAARAWRKPGAKP